ncbi:virulence RhuM family protein [Neglectibacter timonensis]
MSEEMVNGGEILLYQNGAEKEVVNVVFHDENFWLTQKGMAELFGVKVPAISKHLKNIFLDEELDEAMVVSKMEITTPHGAIEGKTQTNEANFYNLDAIIAVGYRVNSKKATRFRQWATKTLKEYIQKGFVLNDEMMKNGRPFGRDYFDELLERIREIRASERRAYQKIADVFEQCSYDYDKNSETTKAFYAFVQNKLHYAVTGKTAAELLSQRATLDSPTMGLTTWKGAPDGKILKSDTLVAKNYLNQKELSRLNRLVTMFIDYAELMAEDEQLMSMQDWLKETDRFLTNNRRQVLDGKGHISREAAVKKVSSIYEEFRKRQDADYISEFDRQTEKYLKGE